MFLIGTGVAAFLLLVISLTAIHVTWFPRFRREPVTYVDLGVIACIIYACVMAFGAFFRALKA